MKKMIALLSVMTVVVALTVPLVAQDHGEMPPEAMKAMMPGEHHEHLGTLAGEFTLSGSAWMKPGAEPTTFTGTRSARMILGGRFLDWLLNPPKSIERREERRTESRIGRVSRRRGYFP